MTKRKLYAKVVVDNGYLQYHTGPDRDAVQELRSLSSRFDLCQVNSPDAAANMAKAVDRWFREIVVYDLEVLF